MQSTGAGDLLTLAGMLFDNLRFTDRLSAAVPAELGNVVKAVAAEQDITVADYLRTALQHRLRHDGVAHPAVPELGRITAPRLHR